MDSNFPSLVPTSRLVDWDVVYTFNCFRVEGICVNHYHMVIVEGLLL